MPSSQLEPFVLLRVAGLKPALIDMMDSYEQQALKELKAWQRQMRRKPSFLGGVSKTVQTKLNGLIPEKVHQALTAAIREMVKGVLFGARITTSDPIPISSLELSEAVIRERIEFYKKTAAAEGGITGAGGILLALAEFPILLGIKMKLLFDIAARYGYDVTDYRERLYLLHVFQLAYSSQERRRQVFEQIRGWRQKAAALPERINEFDWRNFQQEYRDYIDLAKLAQLIPGIGAVVGIIANYRLLQHLGKTAMNAYRMRLAEEGLLGGS